MKQQRAERRASKVAALKKQQATERRNRRITIVLGSVGALAVVGLLVTVVVTSSVPRQDPATIAIADVKTFPGLSKNHVTGPVTYPQTPPVGGDHAGIWLNCGVYSQAVPNENAVHSLEHGAVWITYNPDAVSGANLTKLQGDAPKTYSIVSPFPGLAAPVEISAWGAQVALTGVDDPRLKQFVAKYSQAATAPEPGAACSGGLDSPGRIA